MLSFLYIGILFAPTMFEFPWLRNGRTWSHIQECYTATLLQQVILCVECCLLSAFLSDVWSHSICRSQHMLFKLHLCRWIKELMLSGWREEPKYEVQFSEGTIPVSAAFPGLLCLLARSIQIPRQNILEQTFQGWHNLYSNKRRLP